MPPPGFSGQITLRNKIAPRTPEFFREPLQQKLALDFAAVWRCCFHSCKIRMLIAINVAVEVSAVRRNDCSWGR